MAVGIHTRRVFKMKIALSEYQVSEELSKEGLQAGLYLLSTYNINRVQKRCAPKTNRDFIFFNWDSLHARLNSH